MEVGKRLKVIAGFVIFILAAIIVRTCAIPENVGKSAYEAKCANCHMEAGQGLAELIPAINEAERLKELKSRFACIVFYGQGNPDEGGMKGLTDLTAEEIAGISNYVYGTWAEETGLSVSTVRQQIDNCAPSEFQGSNE